MSVVSDAVSLPLFQETGESALHAAAREGLLSIVHTMCELGCKVDTVSVVSTSPWQLDMVHISH